MNSLKEYGDLFQQLNLSEMTIQEGNFTLVMKKELSERAGGSAEGYVQINEASPKVRAENDKTGGQEESRADDTAAGKGIPVKAPILGIFGELSGERSPIKEGDHVRKGDAVCTIEAMKMINEVVATAEGTVTKVLAKPGDLVEYNQELFIIQ